MKEFSFIKSKNILITGASGFIGYYLSELCAKNGANLYGIDKNSPKNNSIWKKFIQNELGKDALESIMINNNIDYVFHLSGSASVGLSFKNPYDDFTSLVPSTISLLVCMSKFSPEAKLITFSSAAVYGNPISLPINEEDTKNPISPYGIHKSINESLIESYSKLFKIDCSVLRIFSAYGVGLRKQLFWDVMNKYKINSEYIELFGTGLETRDFISVNDVVRAGLHVSNISCKNYFNVYNVANGVETTINDAVNQLFSSLNSKPKIIFKGQNMIGNPLNWRANIDKLSATGFRSMYSISKELDYYFKWFINLDDK